MELVKGPYLGDVTGLCFVRIPQDSMFPVVLAGTGAQVHCYNVETGRLYFSVSVFDGIRVHGIHSAPSFDSERNAAVVAVHGERRVKLFHLSKEIFLEQWQTLPRFTKWVLDVRFLKEQDSDVTYKYLAVGLSDNSVSFWDLLLGRVVYNVHCTENCLLYSMRIWGDTASCLRVAAGTIYNEVVVWTVQLMEKHKKNGETEPVHRFCGHEGSIYRISWSEDGEQIGSVSDDRSARIWRFSTSDTKASVVLFGHNARVWDLHLDEKVFLTASEDCTCGVWSLDGKLLKTLKGHVGRGVWRCIFDSQSGILVTAGADAAMKVYSLSNWLKNPFELENSCSTMETFQLSFGKTEGHRDSKSEYVRCLSFVGKSSLFMGTNNGLLKHLRLLENGELEHTLVFQTPEASPIVCMDLKNEDSIHIALADGQGLATVLEFSLHLQVLRQATWRAEDERQLLGVFWCKSLDSRFLFTTDPRGGIRCWFLESEADEASYHPRLLAYFKSSLSSRIVCVDASISKQVLVCGDQKGNLMFFTFEDNFSNIRINGSIREMKVFRGAHGVSAVASVSISTSGNGETIITSTGRDGCICEITWIKDASHRVSCSRVEKISAITVVESLIHLNFRGASRRIAVGFVAADFVLWDITNEVELKRICCGGWKRPHSLLTGEVPESQFCFAFVKEQDLCIYRSWDPLITSSEKGVHQQALRKQWHGRETHAALFFPSLRQNVDWLITGSEDGTVQITRYTTGVQEELQPSTSLEEHVGGSAVRALALSSTTSIESSNSEETLLFSAGAKEVLTCWKLNSEVNDSISAKWLSTFSSRAVEKDDLRYLALTAFALQNSKGFPVHFVVGAMSNAVLGVKAFVSSSKTWHHLGVLQHHNAPVLSLHHVVLSPDASNRFLVFSGSTDGSIAVWELSSIVEDFILRSESFSSPELELRPLSGRGSQGGKARRRLKQQHFTKQNDGGSEQTKLQPELGETLVSPALVLPECHQSGVNALFVSTRASSIFLVSGGDDQAINFIELLHHQGTRLSLSHATKQENAHGSAVKGVWTDGELVLTTGLDQRLRCWRAEEIGKLAEDGSCVIDVPEAEALDARSLNGSCYRIAIVGRGLQIVNARVHSIEATT